MTTETLRRPLTARLRLLERIRAPFASVMTTVVAMGLLYLCYFTILRAHSLKYPSAVIVAGVGATAFLLIRKKHDFLLFSAGLTLPFFVEIILTGRDKMGLTLTGTLLVTSVMGVVGVAIGVIRWRNLLLEPIISVPALMFVGAGLLSMLNTTDRTLSLLAVSRELEMWVIFLLLVNSMRSQEHLLSFLRGLYLGFLAECVIYGIQNVLGYSFDLVGNTRWTGATDVEAGVIGSQRGTFGATPATAALYFSTLSLLLVGILASRQRLRIRLYPPLGIAAGVACLVLAAKRAPLAGFVLGMMVLGMLFIRYCPGAVRRMGLVFGTLAVPVLVFLPVLLLRAEANHEADYEERVNLTRVAWNMHDAHPIVGVGIGTYDSIKRQYLPPDYQGWVYMVHNRYLLVLAETGAIGMICFLLTNAMGLWAAFRGIRRIGTSYRPVQIALSAGLVAVLWEMNWDIFYVKSAAYIQWYLLSLSVILPRVLPRAGEPTQEVA